MDIDMPKKNIPVKPDELRRNDRIVQTGYRIPLEVPAGRYRPFDAPLRVGVDYVEGYLVERVVDEKIVITRRVSEGQHVGDAIALALGEYAATPGDMGRLKITTAKEIVGPLAEQTIVRLEGWSKP